MYLAMMDDVYGCEYTYVGYTESFARRELIRKIIKSRSQWGDDPYHEYSGITFGNFNFSELKKPTIEMLDDIAEYYGVYCYLITEGRFECDHSVDNELSGG